MALRYFALVYGIVFLLIGVAGFIPALVTPYNPTAPDLAITATSGYLFGLFPVNVLHNVVHLAFGVWGIAAWRGVPAARLYARSVTVVYAIFVVMGFFPVLQTTFGLVPLHGNDIWLHALLAIVAGYFGFAHTETRAPTPAHGRSR